MPSHAQTQKSVKLTKEMGNTLILLQVQLCDLFRNIFTGSSLQELYTSKTVYYSVSHWLSRLKLAIEDHENRPHCYACSHVGCPVGSLLTEH